MKMTGLPLFLEKKMMGPRLFWGLKISHFPLCRTINFAPSLTKHPDWQATICPSMPSRSSRPIHTVVREEAKFIVLHKGKWEILSPPKNLGPKKSGSSVIFISGKSLRPVIFFFLHRYFFYRLYEDCMNSFQKSSRHSFSVKKSISKFFAPPTTRLPLV